jgi:cell division septum initiation protein DivIVA
MADLHSKLDALTAQVEGAKAVPLSASCVLNRAEVLAAIDEIRQLLPAEIVAAGDVLRDREDVLEQGHAEAERIVEAARAERARLVSSHEVAREAQRRADQLITDARDQAATMRTEVEDYVDGKLANFEVVLHKTLAAVGRGRDKLRGQLDAALAGDDEPTASESEQSD